MDSNNSNSSPPNGVKEEEKFNQEINSKQVSLPKRIVFSWRGRRGNVENRAICFGDVDNDKDSELIVGSSEGHLSIFKGHQKFPWRIASKLGTISCVCVGKIDPQINDKNSLIVVSKEGFLFLFEDFTPLAKNAASSISHRNAGTLSRLPSSLSFSNYQSIIPQLSNSPPLQSLKENPLSNSSSNVNPLNISGTFGNIAGFTERNNNANPLHTSFSNLQFTPSIQSTQNSTNPTDHRANNQNFIAPSIILEIPMNVSTVLIEDVDGDGMNELVLGTNDGSVYIYNLMDKSQLNAQQSNEETSEPECELEASPLVSKVQNLLSGIIEIMKKKFPNGKTPNNDELTALKDLPEFKEFGAAVKDLQNTSIDTIRKEEILPFLLNLHNLLILHATVLFGSQPLQQRLKEFVKKAIYRIDKLHFPLLDIEHQLIRGRIEDSCFFNGMSIPINKMKPEDARMRLVNTKKDPRINFALNWATKSSPPTRIYTTKNFDSQLTIATKEYLREEVIVNPFKSTIYLPKLIETWFPEMFGNSKGEAILWIAKYLRPGVAEVVRDNFQVRYENINWDFALKFASFSSSEPSAPKTMEDNGKEEKTSLNNSLGGNTAPSPPMGGSSSYGNSLKSFLGITKKEESSLESPESAKRASSFFGKKTNSEETMRHSKIPALQTSSEDFPAAPISNSMIQAVLNPKSENPHMSKPFDFVLRLKKSHHAIGFKISYFLVRKDSMAQRFLQFGLVDEKDGNNWVGTIRKNGEVQTSPFQLKSGGASEIIEYTGPIKSNGVANNRCVACFSDGHLRITENERTIWEVKVDSEISGMGTISNFVQDDPLNDHIICLSWDGTTHILNQKKEAVFFKMEDKVTTFACGSYSINSGKQSPAIVYVTHTDEIVMYYGDDHMITSMKENNLIDMMQDKMEGFDLLKQDPEWSHQEMASLFFTVLNYEKPDSINEYKKELSEKLAKINRENSKLEDSINRASQRSQKKPINNAQS